jgi:hydantoinase/carbamoylase family amidase
VADGDRIEQRLDALWKIARGSAGGADRPAYSAAEAQAMRLVAGWAAEVGLEPGIDRYGNLWALPAGEMGSVLTSGSHVDTVPDGGRYDGALGTVLGLELIAQRPDAGLLVCAAEEAPRFGAGTLGSRLLTGALAEAALDDMTDAAGESAATARASYLGALDLPRVEPPIDRVRAHAEVHVAQRWALRELGIVTRVASPRRLQVVVQGRSGHSGEVTMADRRDALAAAAEIVLAVEAAARAEPPETVATVGVLEVSPGAVSVIPGRVRLLVDIRAVDPDSLAHVQAVITEAVDQIADRRGIEATVTLVRGGEPVTLDPGLAAQALEAARKLGVGAEETWSGAGHDAQHLAALFPTLLVFVPLHGGESHTPDEGADMDEILSAAAVVATAFGDP